MAENSEHECGDLIDSFEELLSRHLRPIRGTTHYEWVPWRELRGQCTPRFRAEYEERRRRFRARYGEEHAVYVRRYVWVATLKYRARRRRR